jgi:hypothetical protein
VASIFAVSSTHHSGLRTLGCALVAVAMVLSCFQVATAQQAAGDLQLRKADLEVQKLELEVSRLREDPGGLPAWLTAVFGLLLGIAGTAASVWVARRTRLGALDQSVHDKRPESYGELVNATSRLALFFPKIEPQRGSDSPVAWIGPRECEAMGQAMSAWYFNGGGLILSVEARDAYFRLTRALTRASQANAVRVPKFPTDAADISVEKVREYQAELAAHKLNLDDIESWDFGDSLPAEERPAFKFKDYIFLQRFSSRLRTTLSEDLRSRRRPS